MKSFGLIFVLYDPSKIALENLTKVRAICPNVVAVDNSLEVDVHLHNFLRSQGIHVIHNRNSGGLAGAYNRGAEVFLAQGCDAFFLLDQDSSVDKSFFREMVQSANTIGISAFLLGPKIFEIRLQKCMPVMQIGKDFPKLLRIDAETRGLFPTMCIISSGSMITAPAYRKLGPFNEDYFIEYVDVEYSLRAADYGIPVYLNAGVTLQQSNGQIERRSKFFSTHHPAWRRYYIARNMVHCLKVHRNHSKLHWLSGVMAVQQALSVMLFDSHKSRKIAAIACGCVDGLFGRLGMFEQRRPRLAAFCESPMIGHTTGNFSSRVPVEGEL